MTLEQRSTWRTSKQPEQTSQPVEPTRPASPAKTTRRPSSESKKPLTNGFHGSSSPERTYVFCAFRRLWLRNCFSFYVFNDWVVQLCSDLGLPPRVRIWIESTLFVHLRGLRLMAFFKLAESIPFCNIFNNFFHWRKESISIYPRKRLVSGLQEGKYPWRYFPLSPSIVIECILCMQRS